MVIGSGMMATAFAKYIDNVSIVIFASGVSNSKEQNLEAYKREENLLYDVIQKNVDKTIVYFSTCSVYDNSVNTTVYVKHKLLMERMVEEYCDDFYMFRLPQVVGVTTSMTLINFLFTAIKTNKQLIINKNSTRNLIHVDDVVEIVTYIIKHKLYKNEITNIATPQNTMVVDIVFEIEKIMGLKANYQLIDFGAKQDIDISKIRALNMDWNIFHSNYVHNVLLKYYINISGR